ncbi:Hypothetical_protein [Hexamita inflata]|uniref:Hypothetical_protein n=1 Tax=Hexamita inflata TaxID=28002 RepID=A0ABP1HK12_9EUKA
MMILLQRSRQKIAKNIVLIEVTEVKSAGCTYLSKAPITCYLYCHIRFLQLIKTLPFSRLKNLATLRVEINNSKTYSHAKTSYRFFEPQNNKIDAFKRKFLGERLFIQVYSASIIWEWLTNRYRLYEDV